MNRRKSAIIFVAKMAITMSVAFLFGILYFTNTTLTPQQLFLAHWPVYILGVVAVILLWWKG